MSSTPVPRLNKTEFKYHICLIGDLEKNILSGYMSSSTELLVELVKHHSSTLSSAKIQTHTKETNTQSSLAVCQESTIQAPWLVG